jgi:thiol reductant ABC exporter CydC subunit
MTAAPNASASHESSGPSDLLRLWATGRPAAGRLVLAALAGAAALGASIGLTATAAWLIARASQSPPVLSLTVAVVAVRLFGVARPVLRYTERLVSHDAAFRVLADLRARVYARLVTHPPAQLGSRRRGDLLAGVVSDVDAVEDLHLGVVQPAAVAALVAAGCVGFATWLLPSAGLALAVAFLVAGVVAPVLSSMTSRRAVAALAPRRAALSAAVVDLMRGAPDLIAMGAAEQRLREVEVLDSSLTAVARRMAWAAGLGSGLAALAAGAAVWACALVGTFAVRDHDLHGVALAVVVLMPLAAFEAMVPLPRAAVLLAHMRQAARRLFALLDAPADISEPASPRPLPAPPYLLRLHEVRARWTADSPLVLDGLTLELPPGRRVAVIGESGSGKSTLAALLLRFLPAESGSACLNDTDLQALASNDVRRVVGLVADDAHVFGSSLRANLALARPDGADGDFVAALRRAYLGDWYDALPDGLDTWLGEHGALVSGGERRRIALARALLADQPLLVLDEPTEGLDATTAEAVIADLLDAASGRSVVLLTHRPEGLDLVDEVLELSRGRLQGVRSDATTAAAPRRP